MATSPNVDLKDKIEHPQAHYKTPDEIANDNELNPEQRKRWIRGSRMHAKC